MKSCYLFFLLFGIKKETGQAERGDLEPSVSGGSVPVQVSYYRMCSLTIECGVSGGSVPVRPAAALRDSVLCLPTKMHSSLVNKTLSSSSSSSSSSS